MCGNFNVNESALLLSSHILSAGIATDFCESRGLHQVVNFPKYLIATIQVKFGANSQLKEATQIRLICCY